MRYKWPPIIGAMFLVVAMTIQFFVSYQWEKERVLENIDSEIKIAQKDFIFGIYDIQDAGEDMREYIQHHLDQPDKIMHETSIVLKRYPDVLACYASFVPGYYHKNDKWYCPCAFRKGNRIVQEMYGDEQHDYFQSRWYQGALESDKNGYWSPSYSDEDFSEPICTHSVRVFADDDEDEEDEDDIDDDDDDEGEKSRVVCVVGLDFSMEWVDRMLEEIKPFEDACCILYSTDGSVILTSDNMEGKNHLDKDMIIRSSTLEPMGIRLEIGVPRKHVWETVRSASMVTLVFLLVALGVAALMIRRIHIDHEDYARVETSNRLMEQELRIASEIQRSILRMGDRNQVKEPWEDVEVMAALIPMREVGGDLYDFYRKEDDLFFIIGDVSGKSVTAAMFMSATVNLFRSAVRRLQSPKAIMEDMNAVLSDNNPRMMFVTAFIGRLHIPTGELLYCNAGHLSPLKVANANSAIETLPLEPNIPMGYEGTYRYLEQGTMIGKDELLVLYTDGITEARNEQREMLGMKRWIEIVKNNQKALREGDLEAIDEAGLQFVGKADQADDMTLMTILRTGETQPLTVRVENQISQWVKLKQAFHNYALCVGMNVRAMKKMEIALEEAVVNIVNYSKATWMELRVEREKMAAEPLKKEKIVITLTDDGVPFDPTAQAEKDIDKAVEERQIGGLGIALVKQIADGLTYRRIGNTNELIITKST